MTIDNYFEWFKIIHIIALTSWMAGMFYLPRLFVYHTEVKIGTEEYQRFLTMERKLLKIIMNPSMIVTIIFGLLLAYIYVNHDFSGMSGWLHIKIFCALLMAGLHGYFSSCYKKFLHGKNQKTAKFYRIINEIPPVIFIIIVIVVIIKPFG